MAPQLASDARVTATPPSREIPATTAHFDADGILGRTARIAAALLRAPIARAYVGAPGRLRLRGIFPVSTPPLPDDPEALAAAERALRRGDRRRRSWSAAGHPRAPMPRAEPPGAGHLAVAIVASGPADGPDPSRRRAVGAIVLSDSARSAWSAEEVRNLHELAAVAAEGLRLGPGQDAAPAQRPVRGSEPAQAAPPSPGRRHHELFAPLREATALVENIRRSIVGGLHLGALNPGDRLPSIRQTARSFSVSPYMVLQAYAELEMEGLVERRERSGVFVGSFERSEAGTLPETGAWLTEVLTQACQHQVKIPLLPDLIRRWTSAIPIRCACVESCVDSRFALAVELSQQFGLESIPVAAGASLAEAGEVDLIVTTAYHAAEVGPLAARAGRPMLIATVSPLVLSSALNHLRERDLTVVCVDPSYGERMRALQGGAYRERVRVVTVDDDDTLAALDRSEAVLLTPAARQRLGQPDFRLVAPMYPSFSLDFARKVAEALVRINLQGGRA